MSLIHLLDQNTINQIAAGEVIERPASVVKELTENAMDAGATAVTVEIKDGGTSLIRITDNGSGIASEDVALAFLPHATSKIKNAEDLLAVSSLGFRGEALASIASVARVECLTRTPESLTGIRYRIEGGEELGSEEIGASAGTTFLVRDLFYNTPARKKFLKSSTTEANAIGSLIEHLALSHPDVSFRYLAGGQLKLHTSGNHKLKDIIYTVYGREIAKALIPVSHEGESIRLSGFIGRPEVSRGNRSFETYFINGRYIKSAVITRAIEDAYHGFVMQHKYPFAVFHMTIDASLLDVNVHPTKMELRFENEQDIYRAVYESLRSALAGKELIPKKPFAEKEADPPEKKENTEDRGPEPFEIRRRQSAAAAEKPMEPLKPQAAPRPLPSYVHEPTSFEKFLHPEKQTDEERFGEAAEVPAVLRKPAESAGPGREQAAESDQEPFRAVSDAAVEEAVPATSAKQMDLFEEKLLTREARDEYHLIGQVFDTYWLIQYRDTLLIMDQHAAHEKVLFEKTMRSLKDHENTSQQVQPPLILTLSAKEAKTVEECRTSFEALGFQIEPFGGREYAVYAVPANLFGIVRSDLILDMIDGLTAEGTGEQKGGALALAGTFLEEKIAMMSCKAAVKGNNRLSREEANALIDELMTLENPYMCPHGRPTIIRLTRYELEKKFGRVVS